MEVKRRPSRVSSQHNPFRFNSASYTDLLPRPREIDVATIVARSSGSTIGSGADCSLIVHCERALESARGTIELKGLLQRKVKVDVLTNVSVHPALRSRILSEAVGWTASGLNAKLTIRLNPSLRSPII